MKRCRYIVFLLLTGMVGQGCSSRAIHEAEAVVAEADSLWQAGLMYGIDAGDSLTLAQAYETLGAYQFLSPFTFHPSSSFTHACYHYGKLLRAKDDPENAMRCFINATHSRTHDYHILGRVYSNMGSICHLAGEFQLSYDMYEKSANCFLADNDTLSYYFLLNDMAYELAEQGKKDEALLILNNISTNIDDAEIDLKILETKAIAYREVNQYDSTIFYARKVLNASCSNTIMLLATAQAYYYLAQYDSALVYANEVICTSDFYGDIYNALYIISHEDSTLTKAEILQLTSQREDIRFEEYEPLQEKLSHAVQLLEKDSNYSPDHTWLYVLIATLILVGAALGIYIYCMRKKQALLSQKIDKLEQATSIIQEKHNELTARYRNNFKHIEEDINRKCAMLQDKDKIVKTLSWKNYDKMCVIVDKQFYLLASKLRSKQTLNETEIRLCVLTLLDCGHEQMAELLYRSPSSIGTLKMRVAKKLGTTSKHLRLYLIENECIN